MNAKKLQQMLNKLPEITVAVFGDFFLDRYFEIDSRLAEISVETELTAHQVVGKRLSPGAAGTVVSNLKALGVGRVPCLGVIGIDGEGFELKRGLERIGADSSYLIEREDRVTPCYSKPMLMENGKERELERLDIKNRSDLPSDLEDELINKLRGLLPKVDAVIIADQVQERNFGVITDRIRSAVAEIAADYPEKYFLADSRVRIGEYVNVMVKPNKFEAVDAIRGEARPDQAGFRDFTTDEAIECAKKMSEKTNRTVFLTAQEEGIFVVNSGVHNVPAVLVSGEIDPCGAGDSCAAGIVSALCAGATPEEAATLGNIVASITIQKLGQTGTASPEEVMKRFAELA